MPSYRAGQWNGKICVMKSNNTLPYGLLIDLVRFAKKEYPTLKLDVAKDVTEMFSGEDIDFEPALNKIPRDYQLDCVLTSLKFKRGIIRSSTASGKSLIIAYIIYVLKETNNINRSLIIVPTISLTAQFYNDLIEYGIDKDKIGQVHAKSKEWDKEIVISTWQSLSRNHDKLHLYDCVICDEVHSARAHDVKKILEKCSNANYRIGFTGTLPTSNLDMWNVKSFLGPVLRDYGAGELAERGYVSKCKVNMIQINYHKEYEGEYNEIKDAIFNNPFRMKMLEDICLKVDGNILVLVGKVEKEGHILKAYFDKSKRLQGKEIVFLWGDTKVEVREYWRKECEKRKNIVLIATYGILSVGVNIPSLKYILFASPFKSKIRILQSIGRSLRIHEDKTEGSLIFDIVDNVKFLSDHASKRIRYYDSEGFAVEESKVQESIV
jgi:superfamily II DNA or RNA helicase